MSAGTEEIKTRKVELVLQQLDALPTLPAIVVRLLALTNSSESRISEVVQLLSADQSLTSKLLSLAGSAAAGVRVPVTSVQQAVVLLGFETLRNLALSVKVFEVFQQSPERDSEGAPRAPEPPAFKREEFWKHSLAVATTAEMLAAKCKPRINTGDAFVCGLLHDIGKVAFDTVMPKSFARVVEMASLTRGDIADIERRVIGLDHGLAGKRLAEAWNLPQMITQAIWLHGTPPPVSAAAAGTPGAATAKSGGLVNGGIVVLVGLADVLVRRQHIGYSGNYLFPYEIEQYTQHLGLSLRDVDEITSQLADALEARARAIGLYDVESRQVYLESIANANAELGRVNHQLSVQNRRLAARSNCFDLLTRFYQRIVPAASPAQLLAEIGNVAHPYLESHRLVLFSQDPDQISQAEGETAAGGVGEVLLFDPTQPTHESFLMQMPPYGGDHRVGRANQNFARPASPQVDWLLERVRSFLGNHQFWFMPLLCGNEPVGGIVWAARDGVAGPVKPPATAAAATASAPAEKPAPIAPWQAENSDMLLVSQSWGMTLRTAQIREQQTVLTESLAAANRERGAAQQQLVRARSLASLGEMAAGAAHEMNNPLAVVCGRAQLLAAKIHDAAMKQEASLIAQQGERLSQIITDMMEFAKPVSPRMDPLNIALVVEEAAKIAGDRAHHAGSPPPPPNTVHVECAANLPPARGDAHQIKSAVAEIIVNAIQATTAAQAEAAQRRPGDPPREAAPVSVQVRHDSLDRQIIVQVTDQGIGMNQTVMKKAFAPFFSDKKAGRNRGMGLAKALRWIENHGGTIRLDSSPHAGTTAVLILPLNAETAPEPAPSAAPGT